MLKVGGVRTDEFGTKKYLIEKDDGEIVALTFDKDFAQELCDLVNAQIKERKENNLAAHHLFGD